MEDDGVESFLYALQKARAHGVSKVASSSDLPRESLYRSLSDKGNPGIKPLARVLDALGLRLTITPAVAEVASAQAIEEDQLTTNSSTPMQEGQTQLGLPSGMEVSDLQCLVMEALAAVHEEMRAHQEAARREAEDLRTEVQRLTALTQQRVEELATHCDCHCLRE